MLKKSIAWLLTLALCMSIFAGCGNKDVTTDVPVDNTVVDDSVTSTDDTGSDTLVITTAGNVTPNAGVKNVVIEADGVILENASLDSITISPKLGDGTATLKNVKVKTLDANGGGEHSLIINDCEVVTLVANREEGKLHISISVGSTVKTFTISSEVLADIEGGVDNLVVEDTATDPEVNILATSRVKDMLVKALTQIKIDAKVDSVSVTGDAKGSEIEVSKDGKLTKLSTDVPVTTSGEGEIDELVTDDEENMNGSTLKPNETTIDEAPVKNNGAKPTASPKPTDSKVNPTKKPYVKPSPTAAPTVVPTPTAPPVAPPKPIDPVIPTTPPVLNNTADLGVVSSIVAFNDLANGITSGTHEIVADKTLISAIMNGIFAAENATYKIVAAGTTCTTPAEYNALTAAQVKKGTDKFATGDHIYVLSQDGKTLKDYTITAGAAKTLIDDRFTITVSDATYTGIIAAPTVTIEKGGIPLVLDKDYSLIVPVKVSDVAQDNINVGTCKVVIVGKGTYCGDILKDLKIVPQAITIANAAKSCSGKVYDGNTNVTATDLDVTFTGVIGTLTKGTDYTVTGTFEDANVGVNKGINVTVTMLNTKAAKNFTLAEKTKLVTSTAEITAKPVTDTAKLTITNKVDGIAAANAKAITLKKNNAGSPIATTANGTGIYEATGLMNGTYNICVDGTDTGKSVLVNGADITFDLEYFTVKLTNPGDGNSPIGTLKASVNGADITTGTAVLKGTNVTLTAAVNAADPDQVFGYTFKNNTTTIAKKTTDAENTRTFALNEKLDATVDITVLTKITAVTDLAVTAPVKFANALVATKGEGHYTVTSTTWKNNETVETGKFLADAVYTATIILTADANYTFEDCVPTGTLNGGRVTEHIVSGSEEKNTLTVVISYPKTDEAVLPTIAQPVIAGALKVGGTLTATPSNYVGNDGGTGTPTYEYKWHKIDSEVGNTTGQTPQPLGTDPTYTVVKDDLGWMIFVTVVPVGAENGLKGNAQMSEGTTPVPKIIPTNVAKAATATKAYEGVAIDVASLFTLDEDLQYGSYSIETDGTTGTGTLGTGYYEGSKLTVNKLGNFKIKMTTSENYWCQADTTGATCTLTVTKGTAAAPNGLTVTNATGAGAADGKINGTTTAMEYKLSTEADTAYKTCTVDQAGLTAGEYSVRLIATELYALGAPATVIVGEGDTQLARVTLDNTALTISADGATVTAIPKNQGSNIIATGNPVSYVWTISANNSETPLPTLANKTTATVTINDVLAAGAGEYALTVTATQNGGYMCTATCTVTVTKAP